MTTARGATKRQVNLRPSDRSLNGLVGEMNGKPVFLLSFYFFSAQQQQTRRVSFLLRRGGLFPSRQAATRLPRESEIHGGNYTVRPKIRPDPAHKTRRVQHGLTSVVDDVVEASVVTLDQGNPQMLVTSDARLHESSQCEVNLPPSPVRDPLPTEPEDRGARLLSTPGRGLPSRC